jgi:hypothetical protein
MKIATALALMLGVMLGFALLSGAKAEDAPRCQFVGVRDAGLLLLCGDRLNGYVLNLNDVRRQVVTELPGRFAFRCVLAPMCDDEPNIGGFFVDPAVWRNPRYPAAARAGAGRGTRGAAGSCPTGRLRGV